MSRRSHGWSGQTVHDARLYWKQRIALAARTGAPILCYRCGGAVLPEDEWDVDHKVERSMGGSNHLSNQHPSHSKCNRGAGATMGNQARKAAAAKVRGPWRWQ